MDDTILLEEVLDVVSEPVIEAPTPWVASVLQEDVLVSDVPLADMSIEAVVDEHVDLLGYAGTLDNYLETLTTINLLDVGQADGPLAMLDIIDQIRYVSATVAMVSNTILQTEDAAVEIVQVAEPIIDEQLTIDLGV